MPDATPRPAPPTADAAESLWRLWLRGERPDVDAFLARAGELPPAAVAAVLRVDQRERWRLGEGVAAEDYLARHPAVAADAERALDLIFNEFLVRHQCGDRPAPEEFPRRFPEHADALRDQIELHLALTDDAGDPPAAEEAPAPAPLVPGYEGLALVGRGGMGVIYRARQAALNRLVALKMISTGAHAGPAERARFRTEAEAVARLQHPNVVQVFEVGTAYGVPYLALEWMDRGTLAEALAGRPLPPRAAAELVELLARAVQAAHERGVVHRDLKPANVLFATPASPGADGVVGLLGVPKVSDFGLAKELGAGGGQTASAAVLGTPAYMAPEQAAGGARDAGPACDVYSLGAILYECLTGRPPFEGVTALEVLSRVRDSEPVAPGRLRPGLPRDLATVCLTALAKEPGRRYPSAAALADDLRRFLDDRPVAARPAGPWERGRRWCRRNPALAAAAGLALLLLLSVAGVSTLAAWRLGKAQAETSDRLWESLRAQANARRLSRLPGRREESLRALGQAAALRPTAQLRDDAITCLALRDVRVVKELPPLPSAETYAAFDPGLEHYAFGGPRGDLVVCRADDGREVARLAGAGEGLFWLFFSPDGRWLVGCQRTGPGLAGAWVVWDWRAGRRLFARSHLWPDTDGAEFTPDGKQLLLKDSTGPLAAYDVAARKEVWRRSAQCTGLAVHPRRPLLALPSAGRVDLVPLGGEGAGGPTQSLAFPGPGGKPAWSADGRFLAAPGSNGRVYLWDASGELWGSLNCDQERPLSVRFHPGLDLLATSSWAQSPDEVTRLWDLRSGREELTLPGNLLGFSPDGRRLALRRGRRLTVWETVAPACRALAAHGAEARGEDVAVQSVDYSPDGRLLASAAADGLRLWEATTGRAVGHLPPAGWEMALFHPSGDGLWRFQGARSFVWPVGLAGDGSAPALRVGPPRAVALGRADADDPRVRQAAAALAAIKPPFGRRSPLRWGSLGAAAWDGAGERLAVVDHMFGRVFVLRREQLSGPPRLFLHPDAPPGEPWANRDLLTLRHPYAWWVDLSRDGGRVATGTEKDAGVVIWDAATGERLRELPVPGPAFVRFSPDGEHLVTAEGNTYRSWRVRDGAPEQTYTTEGMERLTGRVAFSPDGRLLAVVHARRLVKLLDAATFRELATLTAASPQQITWLCFRPDGSQLAVATAHRQVHLWEIHGIRRQLAALRLDWAPDTPAEDQRGAGPPLRVEVLSRPPGPAAQRPPVR